MRKTKKKGSVLITTIVIFMFLALVSTSFLSLVANNYYARVSENKRVENLYSAESGMNVAYNILQNTLSVACLYGVQEVNKIKEDFNKITIYDLNGYEQISDENKKNIYGLYADIDYCNFHIKEENKDKLSQKINEDNKYIDNIYNYIFKMKFAEFVNNNLSEVIEGNSGRYIKLGNFENLSLENFKYDELSYEGAEISLSDNEAINVDDFFTLDLRKINIEDGYDEKGKIHYTSKDIYYRNLKDHEINYSNVNMLSEFQSDIENDNSKKTGINERNLKVVYEIRIPDYSEITFQNVQSAENYILLPSFVISNNINFANFAAININGDVFNGESLDYDLNHDNRTYEKYSSGIVCNNKNLNKKAINFNQNVYSQSTFNIKNNISVNIDGNLCAKNLYAGNENNESYNAELKVIKDTILDNDLSVKAKDTNIMLENFYGIGSRTSENSKKPFKSSSIIINSQNSNSKVSIDGETYMFGVAHINTQNGYETGESVAVKGNYEAYSGRINKDEKFKYDSPLQVLDSNNIIEKAEHFVDYWNKSSKKVDCGGVEFKDIDKVKSVGAIVGNNGVILKPKFKIEDFEQDSVLQSKKKLYMENQMSSHDVLCSDFESKVVDIANNNRKFKDTKSYYGSKVFNENVDFEGNIIVNGSLVFNKPVNLIGNIIVNGSVTFNDEANITGVILQRGDLAFNKSVNLRGTVIVDGNVTIDNSEESSLNYDSVVLRRMETSYNNLFNELLTPKYKVELSDYTENYETDDSNIKNTSNSLIKSRLWKIVK